MQQRRSRRNLCSSSRDSVATTHARERSERLDPLVNVVGRVANSGPSLRGGGSLSGGQKNEVPWGGECEPTAPPGPASRLSANRCGPSRLAFSFSEDTDLPGLARGRTDKEVQIPARVQEERPPSIDAY